MNGAERILAERKRQIEAEGWTAEHDASHAPGVLAAAGRAYAYAVTEPDVFGVGRTIPFGWPFEEDAWKPSPDPIRNLEKAGALIAAEIDRLLAQEGT